MEIFYVTMNDDTKVTYEGKDLRVAWHKLSTDPNAAYGDYYKPSDKRAGGRKLYANFGQINTTLTLPI